MIFLTAITVMLIISILLSSSLLNTKTVLQSKAAPIKKPVALSDAVEVTDASKWPYMVRISHPISTDRTKSQNCSGVLIAPFWVLTAAHCLVENGLVSTQPVKSDLITVKGGSPEYSKMKIFKLSSGKNVFIHPKYVSLKKEWNKSTYFAAYDLALIKLDKGKNMFLSDINNIPIKQPRLFGSLDIQKMDVVKKNLSNEGELSVVLGWGSTKTNSGMSSLLNQAIMPLVSVKRTIKKWEDKYPEFDDIELVAGFPKGGSRICHGDSGGPLLINTNLDKNGVPLWAIYGITLYHVSNDNPDEKCGTDKSISYFAKITNDNDNYKFIIETLAKEDKPILHFGPTLTQEETKFYDDNICNPESWDQKIPYRCLKQGKNTLPRPTK